MGIFNHFAGAPTVARLFSAPDQKVHGIYHPDLPLTPIWSDVMATRWGFYQFFNGYVRGPEGTSLAQFQVAVNAGLIPGVASDAVVTLEDYFDSLYLMASNGSSFYDTYVKPTVAIDPSPPPPTGDPCADIKAQLQTAAVALGASVATANSLNASLVAIKLAATKARKVLPAGAGGGRYVGALRVLCDVIDEQAKKG